MSKAAMCVKMLELLNSGKTFKTKKLAELLETNPRNIIEYKKVLSGYGYDIESIPGKDGGYRLKKTNLLPSFGLTAKERDSLIYGTNYILERNDFLDKDSYSSAIGKVLSTMNDVTLKNDIKIIYHFPLSMPEEEISKRVLTIRSCIKNHWVLDMSYLSQKNIEKRHRLHPYDLFMYNNAWFVIGWCETYNEVRYSKINRITDFEILPESFVVLKTYRLSDYVDDFGFKSNGEWYSIEFIAYGTYAVLAKERIYGRNQTVESLDPNSTLVKVEMQNLDNILHFLLGLGRYVKVLSPSWLIDRLKEETEEMKKNYS